MTSTDEWRKIDFYSPYYFHTKSEFKMSNKQFWLFCTIFLPMTQTQATTRVFTLYLNFVFWKEGYALYLFLSPCVVTLRRGKNKENRPRRTHVTRREKFDFIFVGQKHEPKIVFICYILFFSHCFIPTYLASHIISKFI